MCRLCAASVAVKIRTEKDIAGIREACRIGREVGNAFCLLSRFGLCSGPRCMEQPLPPLGRTPDHVSPYLSLLLPWSMSSDLTPVLPACPAL